MSSQHQFKRELSQLIRKYAAGLQTNEFADVLSDYHHDLADGSMTPEVEIVGDVDPIKLKVTYSTAIALERDLDDYLEVGGVCLEVDGTLPPLADVVLSIGGVHLDDTVTLRGRAVRETSAGVAFQVTLPQEPIATMLREMPERLRVAAAKAGKQALAQAAKAVASSDLARPEAGEERDARSKDALSKDSRSSDAGLSDSGSVAAQPETPSGPIELDGAPTDTWDMSKVGVPSILQGLLGHQGLGVLDIVFGERHAQLVIDGSQVVDVELYPKTNKESLEGLLEAAGKLGAAEIAEANAHVQRHGVSMAEALVDLDKLSYSEMGVALKTRSRFLLGVMWQRDQGTAKLYALDGLSRRYRAPKSPLGYHVFRRTRDKLQGVVDRDWFTERREFFRAHLISQAASPTCAIDELDVSQQHQRFYTRVLETTRPLSEILRISRLGEQETLLFLECLRHVGLLDLEQANPFTRRRTKFVKQLSQMQSRMRGQNHFEVLGVHWTAHSAEVDAAYEERQEGLSDDQLPDDLDVDSNELVDTLRAKLERSYEVLSDPKSRASYRDEHVDSFEKKTALEMFIKQADTAKLRRDISGAIDAYRRVLELAPQHKEAKKDLVVLEKMKAAEKS
jgi:hypothetical protein